MVRTRKRQELARVSLVNEDEEVVVDMFVKPRSKVIDYQTKYSGITPQLLENCTNDLNSATKTIRNFVKAKDILVGHDIKNDLKEHRGA
ncbi:Oidioi.mRNA.OKI2018_I69.chr2.g6292.t1.cds [Oikopleura dioica]|uniref:Oidioi.mRNA.OKI2018_I69.chr2.g6292.t1.cds n=1 Tax=Oikopleura dioica TaxID=34765 RepID=A0ABN7T6E5_OIKDI|nr:Oidioi.mRNA.OKI2018_I69.chr2.g6292.t1.cds [Oikopleura dioica]